MLFIRETAIIINPTAQFCQLQIKDNVLVEFSMPLVENYNS